MAEEVMGPNVSNRPWKNVRTHRASAIVQRPDRKNVEVQQDDKLRLQRLKELESQLKSDRAAERRARNEKRRLKEEKKKENEIKHAIKHQGAVYVDTRKVRKMDLKARKQLMKVSAEIIQERFGKKH
eukprot:Blabericola_migrator_1__8146@NODE_4200_length_1283_cov_22_526316_g2537_i1_p3_GENE_NODE_4200_length_1283_cov_22_526316_g2537_i1NODE_4200_length_1283_cov_22_526316_g2537_i1_p3_ORF_typecomplete_len127_score34_66Cgr1/PF03879_14/5_4e12PTPlike_phytase/PF14566_6/0_19BTV_NS2/PF04514_12/0_26CEP19/PF14933_6/0_35Spc29/PF17082_5/0_22DUF572/PF04502_13/0_42ExbD/PF02472_16/84ExbD/PF02472_16/1_7Mto2_bdg/PF12808_7/0_12Mto2_bdg/PF12808_7/9_4e03Pox_A11/PF05061_13/0_8SpoIIIAH/PF12685_7/0_84ZapA/PF05164_13/3_NODE_42